MFKRLAKSGLVKFWPVQPQRITDGPLATQSGPQRLEVYSQRSAYASHLDDLAAFGPFARGDLLGMHVAELVLLLRTAASIHGAGIGYGMPTGRLCQDAAPRAPSRACGRPGGGPPNLAT